MLRSNAELPTKSTEETFSRNATIALANSIIGPIEYISFIVMRGPSTNSVKTALVTAQAGA